MIGQAAVIDVRERWAPQKIALMDTTRRFDLFVVEFNAVSHANLSFSLQRPQQEAEIVARALKGEYVSAEDIEGKLESDQKLIRTSEPLNIHEAALVLRDALQNSTLAAVVKVVPSAQMCCLGVRDGENSPRVEAGMLHLA